MARQTRPRPTLRVTDCLAIKGAHVTRVAASRALFSRRGLCMIRDFALLEPIDGVAAARV